MRLVGQPLRLHQISLERWSGLGQIGTPPDFALYITAEAPKWAALVKLSGASIR